MARTIADRSKSNASGTYAGSDAIVVAWFRAM